MGKKRSRRPSESDPTGQDYVVEDMQTEEVIAEEKDFQQVPAYQMSSTQFILAVLCLSAGIYVMISSSAHLPAYGRANTTDFVSRKHHSAASLPKETPKKAAATGNTMDSGSSGKCNIVRKPVSKINSKKFHREYRHMKPLIIQFPDGPASWSQPEVWSLNRLLQKYGDVKVEYGNSIDLAYANDKTDTDMSLAEFVYDFLSTKRNTSFMAYAKFPPDTVNDTLKIPKFLNATSGFADGSFGVGASGSGVAFTRQTDMWTGVLQGRQRWVLYAPEVTPITGYWPGVEVTHWLDAFYSRAVEPMECVLNPGDILYVPGWWYSAFVNLDASVSVQFLNHTSQDTALGNMSSLLESLNRDDRLDERARLEQAFSILLALHETFPDNTEYMNRLGENYAARGDFISGIAATLEAVRLDSDFLVAHLNLGKMHFATGRYDEAEAHFQKAANINPVNADLCGLYGEFLVYRKRVEEGIQWFEKGAAHHPHKKNYLTALSDQARGLLSGSPDFPGHRDAPYANLQKVSVV
ncbi:uncharacterized protein LOC129582707 [Paramacrobiotus metropolitanus]|uniref:uncharacterized protein LOC129582707 n=1 Tax=Paramacrobiotus metropolitanus TaxID=2943436 RepID=UPI0024465630|nr:uncharacterized protein LOC129582707 [Paramacrobiotus metropolitanus]